MNNSVKFSESVLLRDSEVADLLGVNKSSVWVYHNSGRIPAPIRIGGITRWRRKEIDRWISVGCPPREKWCFQQEGKNE